jgi:hypothetical protein
MEKSLPPSAFVRTPTGIEEDLHGCRAAPSQPPVAAGVPIRSIWRTGEELYLTAGADLFHFDGRAWSRVPIDCGCEWLTGVYGTGPSDVHVSAYYGWSFHFDGTTWSKDTLGNMYGVWNSDADCVVMVGPAPVQVQHFQSEEWTHDRLPPIANGHALLGIWGSDDQNILAVGDGGLILRHSVAIRGWGEEAFDWLPEASPTQATLLGVWGSGPKDTFGVGTGGTILHNDGSFAWTSMPSGTSADLFAVSGTASDDVFAVGAAGTVLHFDGKTWSTLASNSSADLKAATPEARGRVIVAGVDSLLECSP